MFAARRVRLRVSAKWTQSWPGSSLTPSYLLSQCKYRSLAPPPSCLELRSAFSSARLASFHSCASFLPSGLRAGHPRAAAASLDCATRTCRLWHALVCCRSLSAYVSACNGVNRGTVAWSRRSGGADVSVQGQDFWIPCIWRMRIRFSAHSLDCWFAAAPHAVENHGAGVLLLLRLTVRDQECWPVSVTCMRQDEAEKKESRFISALRTSECGECGTMTKPGSISAFNRLVVWSSLFSSCYNSVISPLRDPFKLILYSSYKYLTYIISSHGSFRL